MLSTPTPFTLLSDQLSRFTGQLAGVREGGADAIHDARVTTRRLRELLQLGEGSTAEQLRLQAKQAGRALGRVRDVDVRIELLTRVESRLPPVAVAVFAVRQATILGRLAVLRKAIKTLEGLDLTSGIDGLDRQAEAIGSRSGAWRNALQRALLLRARMLRDRLEHAPGVYFPNRAHNVRIALKKLRYAMEIGAATSTVDPSIASGDLRKAQNILGDIHDRQTLVDDLRDNHGSADKKTVADVIQILEAEIERMHTRYLSRRGRLLQIALAAERIRVRRPLGLPAVATSAFVVATGLYVTRRSFGKESAAVSNGRSETNRPTIYPGAI